MDIISQVIAKLNSDEYGFSVELQCEQENIKEYVCVYDYSNNFWAYTFFPDKEKAIDFVMNEILGRYNLVESTELNSLNIIGEAESKPLFPESFLNPPTTKDKLRKYLNDGGHLCIDTTTRAPWCVCVSSFMYVVYNPKKNCIYHPYPPFQLDRARRTIKDTKTDGGEDERDLNLKIVTL